MEKKLLHKSLYNMFVVCTSTLHERLPTHSCVFEIGEPNVCKCIVQSCSDGFKIMTRNRFFCDRTFFKIYEGYGSHCKTLLTFQYSLSNLNLPQFSRILETAQTSVHNYVEMLLCTASQYHNIPTKPSFHQSGATFKMPSASG